MFILIGLLLTACAAPPTAPPAAVPTIAPMATPTQSPTAGEERMVGGAPMVYVPGGEFVMGSSEEKFNEALAQQRAKCSTCRSDFMNNEKPEHTVYLDGFWMDKFQVTNTQYKTCVDAGKCQAPNPTGSRTRDSYYGDARYENYPVIYVSWDDARGFCESIGKRLPTEAEWEKAARGTSPMAGEGRTYPWGSEFDQTRVNSSHVVGDTTPVGAYPLGASPYGIMDMAGNVWEWTADWFDPGYYANSPRENPKGPAVGEFRVQRGGAWGSLMLQMRVAFRFAASPEQRQDYIGFRCAASTV